MRFLVGFISLFVSLSAHANLSFGDGSTLGTICPAQVKPAKAAVNYEDKLDLVEDKIADIEDQIAEIEAQRDAQDANIEKALRRMRRVLKAPAIDAIEEHRKYRRGASDYGDLCPPKPQAPVQQLDPADSMGYIQKTPSRGIASVQSGGRGPASNEPAVLPAFPNGSGDPAVLPAFPNGNGNGNGAPAVIIPGGNGGNGNGGNGGGQWRSPRITLGFMINLRGGFHGKAREVSDDPDYQSDVRNQADLIPPPSVFCADANYWLEIVDDDGKVKGLVCSGSGLPEAYKSDSAADGDVEECSRGLRDYYKATEDYNDYESDLAPLRQRLKRYKDRLARIDRKIQQQEDAELEAELGCLDCEPDDFGSSNTGNADQLIAGLGTLAFSIGFGGMQSGGNGGGRPTDWVVGNNNGFPGSAPVLLPPTQATVPNGSMPDFYPAQVPGYYNGGSNSQQYGAIPGGMDNAFRCSDMNGGNSALNYPAWMLNLLNQGAQRNGGSSNNQFAPPTAPAFPNGSLAPPIQMANVGAYWEEMYGFQQGLGLINGQLPTEPPPVLPAFPSQMAPLTQPANP